MSKAKSSEKNLANFKEFKIEGEENSYNFMSAEFQDDVDFSSIKFGKVYFENAVFRGSANFIDTVFKENVSFGQSKFNQVVDFSNTIFEKNADFGEVQFNDEVYFYYAIFKGEIRFDKVKFKGTTFFDDAQFFQKANFYKSQFDVSAYFRKVRFLGKADFRKAIFHENSYFNEISTSEDDILSFWQTEFNKKVEFTNSSIYKSTFLYAIFNHVVIFTGAILSETNFVGSVFKEFGLFNNNQIDVANRETFRIVKHELLKNNNKIDALLYHEKEMQAYRAELKKLSWNEANSEKFILFMNRFTNRYGLKWVRSIVFTLGVALFFYIPYILWGLSEPYFQWGWEGWPAFAQVANITVKNYFQFLYAAHNFNFMDEYNPNSLAYFLDFTGRIFIGYGYYQTIQAFRKFGRW